MKRVRGEITEYRRNLARTYNLIRGAMAVEGVKQCHIAEELGLHKTTVSQHFKHKTFSFEQILQIFEFLDLEFTLCAKPL